MKKFKCDCCSLSCRQIDRVSQLKNFDSRNGVCKFLKSVSKNILLMMPKLDILFLNLEMNFGGFLRIYYLSAYLRQNLYAAKGFFRHFK